MMEPMMESRYAPSEDVIARMIEEELILVPLASGMGDTDDELYTLNETGKAIWNRLDGKRTLRTVAEELVSEFQAPPDQIETDVLGLVTELKRRRMVVEQTQ
jgi:hypothetical protein